MQTLDKKLRVLVFGSGARENAIADSISKSKLLDKLYLAQPGFFKLGEIIEFSDFEDLAKKCSYKKIDLAIFGPEGPLCEGIVDVFNKHNIACVGVNKDFSKLESSKLFGKKFMEKHGIKTAKYSVITEEIPESELPQVPFVIKADGLCGGKGAVIAKNIEFAKKTIKEFLEGKFGENSKTILIEEFLSGEELSLMSLWDGKNLLHFAPSRDFKKLNKSESAPNTGGMGAYCPVKLSEEQEKKLNVYKNQLKHALISEKVDFVGFIYSGLIWSQNDWHVLEYNVRLGDPETQAILSNLKTDFLYILKCALEQSLDKVKPEYQKEVSACLTIACEGYPKSAEFQKQGKKITFPARNEKIKIFFAGVEEKKDGLYSAGGRVLSLCTTSEKPFADLKQYAKEIKMENKYFRSDIDIN